ncbi:ATP-binding cassette domain-containing protein [Actinoplanes sp. TBRC 11911]|uniref:ATP-binding cassette domain-containing protein n=1 Tax=Actinoplanes sp. TBRC 11911 TaxID=2729386 RepID=UPI00145DB174|nr:ATP-binding cassette domain-containing protein [Actinoplanes sp. TBRC 11911]NMO56434.1 ATP-binding cassette domain-containing protein [Actinoplanes sp. TBRC 11911]
MVNEQTTVAVVPATMTLTGITKNYDGVAALTGVDLTIRPGEVHALLGENGAGKSTLMGVAAGAVTPDAGSIAVGENTYDHLTPAQARALGIAIVHQHPAVMPDMTVGENIRVAVPAAVLRRDGDVEKTMRAMLADVGCAAHLQDRVESLSIAQKHLLELAKALVVEPSLLILDEPTAPLGPESVNLLFDRVRAVAAGGTAVVYITHRLAEVRALANRVTVLRDGTVRGGGETADISDDELLALIVGRKLDSTFPPKVTTDDKDEPAIVVEGLSGRGFHDVSFTARRGEIIGISGIAGNGQSALLRALAGLEPFSGTVGIGPEAYGSKRLRHRCGYLPADRHREGLMMSLSVRENAALSALRLFTRGPLLSSRDEAEAVAGQLRSLAVKTPSQQTMISALSGGNQQKVVLARALLSAPAILVADDPTQGVDVGARSEIYRILREIAAEGVPVVIASSDAKELEGLCDRVVVMSRGAVVQTVEGDAITEEALIHAAVRATGHRREEAAAGHGSTRLRRFLLGDYAPVIILALVMLGLGAYVYATNDRYLSAFNITSVMTSCAALGFIALGQTVALLVGGIDLSVGPLAGFMVVVGSFFLNDGRSAAAAVVGLLLMLLTGAGTGAVNGTLIRYAKFTPVAATLATYIALQGLSFLLRDSPGGNIGSGVTGVVTTQVGPVPLSFVVMVLVAVALEFGLRRSRVGLRVRAVGSSEESARRVAVKVTGTVIGAYMACSALVFLGAIVLLAQLGIGDPAQGVGYTLSSITAVILGGTSLLGGRGTFIGTLLGAGLIVQVLNATVFLDLTQTWQYFFQGALVVVAAVVYSRVRGAGRSPL